MRRGDGDFPVARALFQASGGPFFVAPAGAHLEQRPHERANHRVAEGVGPRGHLDEAALAFDLQLEELADRRRPFPGLAIGNEIVFPRQLARSGAHRLDVERLAKPQNVAAPQRIETGGVVAHPVRIGPGKRGKPCVEACGREIHAGHRDVRASLRPRRLSRQQGGKPAHDRLARVACAPRRACKLVFTHVDVGDLTARVDAGVGPPGDGQGVRAAGYEVESFRHRPFDGSQTRLDRPTMKVSAVVGHAKAEPMRYRRIHDASVPHLAFTCAARAFPRVESADFGRGLRRRRDQDLPP